MSNEFPKISEVLTLDKAVTYKEAVEQVWIPQDNAMVSVPSVMPIETLVLDKNIITPTVALGQIMYYSTSDGILNFIDYSKLRDGAVIQLRIQDDTYPITIKNGIVGNGSILTADGTDILLDDYRKIVQFQREGTIWRQVGGVSLPTQVGNEGKYLTTDGKKPSWVDIELLPSQMYNAGKYLTTDGENLSWSDVTATTITYWE